MRNKQFAFLVGSIVAINLAWLPSSFAKTHKKAPAKAASSKGAVLELGTQGDNLAFTKTALTVKAGEPVTLTFKNNSSASSGLQHNFVLVKPGTADEVGQAGMTAGPDKNYIPDNPNIIAHTKLVNSGKSETIHFTAPTQPGAYPYICTFPGHYMTMKGTMTVK